jgi:hypothetical protein
LSALNSVGKNLWSGPAFKLPCERLPDTCRNLCSQPTLSRLENAPRLRDVIRLTYTLVDAWVDSYPREPPVAVVLRPGKTPGGGVEVRAHLRRLIRHIRTRWHKTRITFRGDGHYARPEAMTWCENNGIDYIFGLPGTSLSPERSTMPRGMEPAHSITRCFP